MKNISDKGFYEQHPELYEVITDRLENQKSLHFIPDYVETEDVFFDEKGAHYAIYQDDFFTDESHNTTKESKIIEYINFMTPKDIEIDLAFEHGLQAPEDLVNHN